MEEIGQIIGVITSKKGKYCKLYFIKGSLKDNNKSVYKTTIGTTNITLLNSVEKVEEGDLVKCSIIESYPTGINYGIKNSGLGYKVNVLEIVNSKLSLDY